VKRIMLINVLMPEESRVAVLENNILEELYIERSDSDSCVGNIYKARVSNVEPSLQAAFVDIGQARNGFLHVSDVMPSLAVPSGREGRRGHARPPIQHIVKRGQEVVVQVTKHSLGKKGAAVTTFLSVAGKYLVLMPGLKRVGVSRKITDDADRTKLKALVESLNPPKELGVIARTAACGRNKRELNRDFNSLKRLWSTIQKRIKRASPPALIYQESDFVIRTMRDIFSTEIDEVYVDSEAVWKKAKEFLLISMPRSVSKLKLYEESTPLFHRHEVEEQVENIYRRRVQLPGGGYLVIEQTEALVAIDVNSGTYHGSRDSEKAALEVNLEAAAEIGRQIRLRDLGGVLICDFIDMVDQSHRARVELAMSEATKRDRARRRILKMSRFGIIEMTRQRIRSSVERSVFEACPGCEGRGFVKSAESMALSLVRDLTLKAGKCSGGTLLVRVHPAVEDYLQNRKRSQLVALESQFGVELNISADRDFQVEKFTVEPYNDVSKSS